MVKFPWKLTKTAEEGVEKKNGGSYSFLAILFSVFLALMLWFYVQEAESPDYKKTFTSVSVELQSLSSSFSVIEGGENTVDITLVGKRSDLNKMKAADLEAFLDLRDVTQPGSYQAQISVLLPEGTELLECFPKEVNLFVDQTVSTTVPVRVELGRYTVGQSVGLDAKPMATQISVKGPKTILDQIDCAKVITGDLGEVTSSFEKNLSYALYDQNGEQISPRYLVLPEPNLRVQFTVYKTKSVPLTVQCKNGWWPAESMNYTVSPANVIIKGDPALIDTISSVPAAILDETQVDTTRWNATLAPSQLPLPNGVSLGETLGDIKVSLSLSGNASRTLRMNFNSNHVVITPPEGGLSYQFVDSHVQFKIRGNQSTIGQASINDFYLNIDLSPYTSPGQVEAEVHFVQTSASEGKFYPVGTYKVKVQIS